MHPQTVFSRSSGSNGSLHAGQAADERRSVHPGRPNPLTSHETPLAAVFEDDGPTCRAVGAIVEGCGFGVVSFAERPVDVVSTVKALRAEVVVLELAMAGAQGLRIVRDVLDAAPGCAVILLAPFENLRESAISAGAFELITNDLGILERCLHELQGRRASSASEPTSGAGMLNAHRAWAAVPPS